MSSNGSTSANCTSGVVVNVNSVTTYCFKYEEFDVIYWVCFSEVFIYSLVLIALLQNIYRYLILQKRY